MPRKLNDTISEKDRLVAESQLTKDSKKSWRFHYIVRNAWAVQISSRWG